MSCADDSEQRARFGRHGLSSRRSSITSRVHSLARVPKTLASCLQVRTLPSQLPKSSRYGLLGRLSVPRPLSTAFIGASGSLIWSSYPRSSAVTRGIRTPRDTPGLWEDVQECTSRESESPDIQELQREHGTLLAEVRMLLTRLQHLGVWGVLGQNAENDSVRSLLREACVTLPGCASLSSLANEFTWGRVPMSGVVDGTLEILQQGLDDPSTDSNQRNEIFRLLLRSVVDLSVLPPSYYIQGVTRQHTEPHRMGGFADVYRAMWQSQAVAIKVMRMFSSSQAEDRDPIQSAFLREIVVSRQVEHPFVQPFWGVDRVTFAPRLGLISPWQPYGNINEAMDTLSRDNTPIPYNIWLLQIAKGLQHLHCIGIVHGDLRGANILIDEHLHPRLTDFGLSILADAYTRTLGSQGGVAVRWSPPELISGVILRPNFASDVYAFGCTCIELYGRQKPFGHISNDVQVIYQLALGAQPERPTAGVPIPELLWHLISQCLDKDPARRPTVTDIVRQMEVIVQS